VPSFAIASNGLRRCAREIRRDFSACVEERRGFAIDHRDVVLQGRDRTVTEPGFHHFAFGELDACLRRGANHLLFEAGAQFECAAEQVVAGD